MLKGKTFQEFKTDWLQDAACRNEDTNLFFTDLNTGRFPDLGRAREICGSCPSSRECLDYAVSSREDDGLWGGMTEPERTALRMQWGRSFPRLIKMLDANVDEIFDGFQS